MRPIILIALAAASALGDGLPRGRIIDKVVCTADSRQSYALYLPSRYSPDRAWPILYCLEPLARGRLPVERFSEGAEQYGYVVAGSYNSRNGPIQPAFEALQAMWRDTHETLSIDDRRAYLAGMSGGARDATAFLSTRMFAGIIAEAAGFSGSTVPKDFTLPFFGTAGVDDFNYGEMRQVDRELEAHGSTHRLVLFAGPHGWAPAAVCAQALAWFDLVAMRAGALALDRGFIHARFVEESDAARASEAAGDTVAAYLGYRSLAVDYRGWEDTAAVEKKAGEIQDSKEYRKALKAESGAAIRQQELESKLFSIARGLTDTGRPEALMALREAVEDLRAKAAAAQDSDNRRVARRVMSGALVSAWERSSEQREKRDYSGAAASMELASLVEPDNAEVLYNLAGLCALANDRGRALSALKAAVAKGFRDSARLHTDPAFDSVREKAEGLLATQAAK